MAKYLELEIDNSAASAIKTGKWNAPGAAFYDQLLNSFHYGGKIPEDAEELNKCIREGKYRTWVQYLEEAYLIAPVKKIHNSPHGVTPFSRSGCKYPHHVIKGNKLVLSVPGIKAAYARALQMGVLKGDVKKHLERHIHELGLEVSFKSGALSWNEACEVQIEENFRDIYATIMEHTGINLFESEEYFGEASHGSIKQDHRIVYDIATGHECHIIYDTKDIKFDVKAYKAHNIMGKVETPTKGKMMRKGDLDHLSYNQKVLAIVDMKTKQRLNEIDCIGVFQVQHPEVRKLYGKVDEFKNFAKREGIPVFHVKVGEIETTPTYKSTFFPRQSSVNRHPNIRPIEVIQSTEGYLRGRSGKLNDLNFSSGEFRHPRKSDNKTLDEEELVRTVKYLRNRINLDRRMLADAEKDLQESINDGDDQYLIDEAKKDVDEKKKMLQDSINRYRRCNDAIAEIRKHKNTAKTESSTDYILVDPDDSERVKHMQEEGYVWADWKNRGHMQPMVLSEAVIEGPEENPVLTSDFNDEVGETIAEALWNWMHDNIQYDDSLGEWKLRTAAELYIDKKGNCHDQAYFASFILNSWGYDARQLFFVEFDDDSDIGGNSHTLCYFRKREPDAPWYWFENAWEDQAGIHGPFENVEEVKQAVMKTYEEDNDINSHKFDGIVFGSVSKYRLGMNLHDYVDSWTLDDDRRFADMNKDPIQEAMELLDWITEAATNKDHQETMSDVLKKCKTPQELLNWMDCIEYGWIDKAGNKNGTGESDDTSKMWAEYKLQSPLQLIRSKTGVCWDQCELERVWFQRYKYPFTIVYLEIDDDEAKPSHTFLVYKEPGESSEVYWFEHSWGQKKGIHKFSDFGTCMQTVIQQFEISQGKNHEQNPVYKHMIIPAPKYGINVIKYMEYAHKRPEIDLGDIQYDDIFGESVSTVSGATSYQDLIDQKLIDHPSYSRPKPIEELPEDLKEDPIHLWRASTGIELIHREPTLTELDRIWRNWNLMSIEHQEISDKKSIEFFGMDNSVHYHYLRPQYATQLDSPYFVNSSAHGKLMAEDAEPPEMANPTAEQPTEAPQEESKPKKVDRVESPKNGVRRKKLYIAFIEWCKEYNDKNAFGSIFDEDAFKVSYPFVPEEMRYFYRLANPMLCVLSGDMTFFPVAELRKLNAQNSDISNQLIFAATPNDVRVFNCRDKKVYRGTYENGALKLNEVLSNTFDTYIQSMIKKGDILTAPLEDE